MNNEQKLPYCEYPKAKDIASHGLQELPSILPSIDWGKVNRYRNVNFNRSYVSLLDYDEILESAHLVAKSFAKNEAMRRTLKPARVMPHELKTYTHTDELGRGSITEWSAENIEFWTIRLFHLTNPSDLMGSIHLNNDSNDLSLVFYNDKNEMVGVVYNSTVNVNEPLPRVTDPLMVAVSKEFEPIHKIVSNSENQAHDLLKEKYPEFDIALANKKVCTIYQLAKSEDLPSEHAFELFASAMEELKNKGFSYMVTCAANQWTGSACEVFNGIRVNFEPYRAVQRVNKSGDNILTEPYTNDGFISNKDSGLMYYIVKLI